MDLGLKVEVLCFGVEVGFRINLVFRIWGLRLRSSFFNRSIVLRFWL